MTPGLILALVLAGCPRGSAWAAPELGPDALLPLGTPGLALGLDVGAGWGLSPPFSMASADLAHLGLSVRWAPAPQTELRLRMEGLRGSWPDGTAILGPGDLRAGAAARVLPGQGPRPAAWLDVGVKLPNAADEGGLGTDETDVHAAVRLRWVGERGALTATGGLLILGDPLRYAAQDDAALVELSGAWTLGSVQLLGQVGGRLASPRNAADLCARVGAEWGRPEGAWRVGAELGLGLTPAAPDAQARLWLGVQPTALRPPTGGR